MLGQFLRFALVGALGFFVDAGVLLLARWGGLDLYSARAVSFLSAVTFTWALNRRFTFRAQAVAPPSAGEWARFAATNAVGGLVNLAAYALLVTLVEPLARWPVLAVAAGSAAGLGFNFLGSRLFVYGVASAPGVASAVPQAGRGMGA